MTLGEAYERYFGEITGYLRKSYPGGDIAEDAAQQAFANAAFSIAHSIGRMPEAAVRAWLYATARNAAIDMLRRQKKYSYGDIPDDISEETAFDDAERIALGEALDALTELQRNIVEKRWIQGYNAAEIGAVLGMNAANIRYHLMTAMRRLRHEMKEE